ncbi:MAG: hypothetical protein LBP78_04530, partial [Acidaminococcales bacterium]|nr:hypothetical protein [Acidaminococcales bacterium]
LRLPFFAIPFFLSIYINNFITKHTRAFSGSRLTRWVKFRSSGKLPWENTAFAVIIYYSINIHNYLPKRS